MRPGRGARRNRPEVTSWRTYVAKEWRGMEQWGSCVSAAVHRCLRLTRCLRECRRFRSAWTAACAVLLAVLSALSAPALAIDPRLTWQTLETEHFSIHFHDGLEAFARRTGTYAEEAWTRLVPFMETAPKERVEVVISDITDSANGSATVFPRALIRLYPTPPENHSELNDSEDWLWTLIVHELTHVLHMSDIRGLPKFVDTLIGRQWIPNAIQPNWIVEGLAIQSESRFSTGGRNRSSLYDMQLRLMALEGTFPDLDDISGSPAVWPRGGIPYLCGARFIDWLVRNRGPDTPAALSHDHADMILPLFKNLSQSRVTGKSWHLLFEDWKRDETRKAEQLLETLEPRGLTRPNWVTQSGERTGKPKFCRPDGNEERLCFIDSPGTRRPSLRSVSLSGGDERVHAQLLTAGDMAVSPDGKRAVVSQTVTFETDYSFEDLYEVELDSGAIRRLTRGLRASEPSFTPDGRSILFVRRVRGGLTSVSRLELASGKIADVFAAPLGGAVFSPVLSPDGRRLAVSLQTLSGRVLAVMDASGGRPELLTAPRGGLDIDPVFTPDGGSLIFSSDESGVYDLFRLDLATGKRTRLTRVISGAFSPAVSSDGTWLAFEAHSARGSDAALHRMDSLPPLNDDPPLDRNRGKPEPFLRAFAGDGLPAHQWTADASDAGNPNAEPKEPHPSDEAAAAREPAADAGAGAALHPYRPWQTLRAYAWMPEVDSDVDGTTVGFSTFGEDAVGLHSWTLNAGYGLESHQPFAAASYTWRGIRPILTFGASGYYGRGFFAPGFPERVWTASADASWPFGGANYAMSLSLGLSASMHQALGRYRVSGPSSSPPIHPANGFVNSIYGGISWSNAWSPAQGISPTEGWRLSLSVSASGRWLGSEREYAAVSGSVTRYLAMPWSDLHVLALRLRGGIGWNGDRNSSLFSLGGSGIRNLVTDYIQGYSLSTGTMRGYRAMAALGNTFFQAGAEYRLPIAILDGGLWTLPVYFRRLHGALTADLGWAGRTRVEASELLPSVGAVLRLETLLAYDYMTQIQLGYAFGFGRQGIHNVYLGLGGGF